MTKSLTLMLTVISESNFPYFDGSIFHNFTIVCFALLRLRAGAGVMKQRKLQQQLCEEILLGCCLAQVMAAADIRALVYLSYLGTLVQSYSGRIQQAIITPHGGCNMRISSHLARPGWCLANHGWSESECDLIAWWVWGSWGSHCRVGSLSMSLSPIFPPSPSADNAQLWRDQSRGGNKKLFPVIGAFYPQKLRPTRGLLQPIRGQWEAVIETNDSPEANCLKAWRSSLGRGEDNSDQLMLQLLPAVSAAGDTRHKPSHAERDIWNICGKCGLEIIFSSTLPSLCVHPCLVYIWSLV